MDPGMVIDWSKYTQSEVLPIWISNGPLSMGVRCDCGMGFHCYLRRGRHRSTRWFYARIDRHTRRCTAARRAKRARRGRSNHHG